jgi:hypothetical protein
MNTDQLRKALGELHGDRDAQLAFAGVHGTPAQGFVEHLKVRNAMLIPDEADHLLKLTDGKSIFIIDAERVAWIRIG